MEGYLRTARRLGDPWTMGCALMDNAWVLQRKDEWARVDDLVAEVEALHRRTPMPYFWIQAEGLMLLRDAARGDWAGLERRAAAFHLDRAGLNWFYGNLLFGELRERLAATLREEARPTVERLLRRKGLEPWIREGLEAWASGKARTKARPRGRMGLPPTSPTPGPRARVTSAARRSTA